MVIIPIVTYLGVFFLKSPNTYVPKKVPYKKYLTDLSLKADLEEVLDQYAVNSSKLTHIGSSQRNESFNNKVSSKNPKSKYYSGSESTCFRVAAVVAETNNGTNYLTEVNIVCLKQYNHVNYAVKVLFGKKVNKNKFPIHLSQF